MHSHVVRFNAAIVFLMFLLLIASACSSNEADSYNSQPSNAVASSTPSCEAEETPGAEATPAVSSTDSKSAILTEVDWESYFDGINGAAVLYRPSNNSYQIYNSELALTRRSPCSTFKIVSSLIALENHIITPGDSLRTWSGEIFWNEQWNKNIDFAEAFRTSCVWYFRELIDEIGKNVMQDELDKLHYGNCDISDWEGHLNTNNKNPALTGFWIESSLKISPKEQVEVMATIFGDHSAYSEETLSSLKQVMLIPEQQTTDAVVYGKTGMGKSLGVVVDAWFTGLADVADERIYFCVYLGETAGKDVSSTKAKEIALELISSQ